jgi:hypothetical protein
VLKLDEDGAFQWHTFYGSSDSDMGFGIVMDPQGDPIITGISYSTWQGDSGANPLHAYSAGNDIVTLKLSGAYLFLPHVQR